MERERKEKGKREVGKEVELLVLRGKSVFQTAQAFLLCQQFLPLFLNLSLHLELNLSQLVLLSAQLLFLETDTLVCQLIARNSRVCIVAVYRARELWRGAQCSKSVFTRSPPPPSSLDSCSPSAFGSFRTESRG